LAEGSRLCVQESCSDVEIKLDLFALSLFVGSRDESKKTNNENKVQKVAHFE
jgi:hypothetical protein